MATTSSVSDAAKLARIEIKTSPQVKTELEKAAAISGVTLTSFIINLARAEALKITGEAESIRLNQQAWERLNEVIENPQAPTDALKDLMKA